MLAAAGKEWVDSQILPRLVQIVPGMAWIQRLVYLSLPGRFWFLASALPWTTSPMVHTLASGAHTRSQGTIQGQVHDCGPLIQLACSYCLPQTLSGATHSFFPENPTAVYSAY